MRTVKFLGFILLMVIGVGFLYGACARQVDQINSDSGFDSNPDYILKSDEEMEQARKTALAEDQPTRDISEVADMKVQNMSVADYGTDYQTYPGHFPPELAAMAKNLEKKTFSQTFQDQQAQGMSSKLQTASPSVVAATLEKDGKLPQTDLDALFGPPNTWGKPTPGVDKTGMTGRYAWPERMMRPFTATPVNAFLPSQTQVDAYKRICAPANPKLTEAGSGYKDLCIWLDNAYGAYSEAVTQFDSIKSTLPTPDLEALGAYRKACLADWSDPQNARDYASMGTAGACMVGTMWITGKTTS